MSEKITVDLGSVQTTLFLPLWGRAQESIKPNPLLVDPMAVKIVEQVDFDFSALAKNLSQLSQVGWIMRSLFVDEIVAGFLEEHPGATIVDIGCGLETTFERIDNGKLLWIDLDLPDVIALRKRFIPRDARCKEIAGSFLETDWMDGLPTGDGLLFIVSGVLYYFEAEVVRGFLKTLADRFPGAEIVFDVCSPFGIKAANRMVLKNSGVDEGLLLKWSVKHTDEILAWDDRFTLLKSLFYFKDKRIPANMRFMGWISDLMKAQYMVHMRLGERH